MASNWQQLQREKKVRIKHFVHQSAMCMCVVKYSKVHLQNKCLAFGCFSLPSRFGGVGSESRPADLLCWIRND